MAKTEGPLFSLKARGSLANLLTYQGRKWFDHVHKKSKPRNPQSASQTANREDFADAIDTWHLLTTSEKETYKEIGIHRNNIPGFNAFISINKGKTEYWTKFGACLFGEISKFGGPEGQQIT